MDAGTPRGLRLTKKVVSLQPLSARERQRKPDLGYLVAEGDGRTIFETLGPTGFDSETNGDVSMPSAGIQLVNLMTQPF